MTAGSGRKNLLQPITAESRYARSLSAGWLLRLLERNLDLNREFLACLSWSVSGLRPLLGRLRREIGREHRLCLEDDPTGETTHKLEFSPAGGRQAQEIQVELKQLLQHSEETIQRKLDAVLEEHDDILAAPFRQIAAEACARAALPPPKPLLFKNGEKHLAHLFGLEPEAVKVCVFIFMLNAFGPVENYFSDSLGVDRFNGRRTLAQMLEITPGRCRTTINTLKRLGIIDADSYSLRLEDKIFDLWDESSSAKAAKLFCRPLAGETLPLSAFPLPQEEVGHVLALLKPRLGKAAEKPVHILLYGPPGTGKTTFARSLAAHYGIKAWSVPSQHDEEESGRRASLNACINLVSRHPGAFVLVDEAERLLDSSLNSRRSHDKAWINELMEQPGCRVIWATNHVGHIEQAVRRRFTYSLQFEDLALAERRDIWAQVLKRHGMGKSPALPLIQELMKNYSPPVAVINEAVQQGVLLAGRRSPKAFAEAVGRVIAAHDTLRRDGYRKGIRQNLERNFTLEGISLSLRGKKNAREEVENLLASLKKADKLLRSGSEREGGSCSLLFHGPPGTGKSALARYIAAELKREYLPRKASDLLSPYVGMSERNIAAAFREAEREGALLLIDEADSFIFSRSTALRSWEGSMVNEFLTALEEFSGFCICTTNRRADMDQAAMRRFSFKVAFDYSGPEQSLALYQALLAPLLPSDSSATEGQLNKRRRNTGGQAAEKIGPKKSYTEPDAGFPTEVRPAELRPAELRMELGRLKNLTPGDFHAVRARARLLPPEKLSHAVLLAELAVEVENKLEKASRSIGF